MKRLKLLILIIIMLLTLSSCSLIQYTEDVPVERDGLDQLKSQYLDQLLDFSFLDEYRERQKQEYIALIVETRSRIDEANSEEEILLIYADYLDQGKNIKKAFEAAKDEAIEEIGSVNLEDYYEYDYWYLSYLLEHYSELVASAQADWEIDNYITEFEIKLSEVKSIATVLAEQLQTLKDYATYAIYNCIDPRNYREAQQSEIYTIRASYYAQIQKCTDEESINRLRDECCEKLYSQPTDAYLSGVEKAEQIESSYNEIVAIINGLGFNAGDKDRLLSLASSEKTSMSSLRNVDAVIRENSLFKEQIYLEACKLGISDAFKNYRSFAANNLVFYEDAALYRDEQKTELNEIAAKYYNSVLTATDVSAVEAACNKAFAEMDKVLTNDELWALEDQQFFIDLAELYGSEVLDRPASMTLATSYEELVKIMDYYAFYQLDGSSFVRGKFRVKCSFNSLSPQDLRNQVYWMCELYNVAVGVVAYYDINPEYIVFELKAYDIASRSNASIHPYLGKKNETVTINDNEYSPRDPLFDDFAYYKNSKTVKVWNSQQLWYALEHNYVPICQSGSSAEAVLNKAKEVLREIVSGDMTNIEKIKAIYTWIGLNCEYDNEYQNMPKDVNIEDYPFAHFADLTSVYPEGLLFDGIAVCSGYAKTYLMMLKIEGIDALRAVGTHTTGNTINRTYHEYVYINVDGLWYFSDVERAPHRGDNSLTSIIFMMLSPYKEMPNTTQVVYPNLNWATSRYEPLYASLSYDGLALDDFAVIQRFAEKAESGDCCSLIVPVARIYEAENLAKSYGLGTLTDFWYADGTYQELIIYK